jgi:hypothetical protein
MVGPPAAPVRSGQTTLAVDMMNALNRTWSE